MSTVLWLVKLALFFLTSFIIARVLHKFFLKRDTNVSINDPEIITISVIAGAAVTGLVMFLVKRLI